MKLRVFLLLVLTVFAVQAAEEILWQNDFEQTDDIGEVIFGLPYQAFSCQGQVVNQNCGKKNGIKIIYKGFDSKDKFAGNKSLKIEIIV